LDVDISAKIIPQGWKVVPKRCIVERTFAWLNNSRRLSKDYEHLFSQSYDYTLSLSYFTQTLVKTSSNILNSLVGSKDIETDFEVLVGKYPKCIKAIPTFGG